VLSRVLLDIFPFKPRIFSAHSALVELVAQNGEGAKAGAGQQGFQY
jgi:hypothetical protein